MRFSALGGEVHDLGTLFGRFKSPTGEGYPCGYK
nr:MAG TPA: hypothetical protein [Bacteriophage sp.]